MDAEPAPTPKSNVPGGPGSQWRMMKLRRVYEAAEEEGKPVEEVALQRFDSLEAFEEAREERRILDEREGRRASRGGDRDRDSHRKGKGRESGGERSFMFTDIAASGASSRSSSYRKPGFSESAPSTPSPAGQDPIRPVDKRFDSLRLPSQASSPLAKGHTPIPSVMIPSAGLTASRVRAMSPSSLNRLQAKVLRAKLMNSADADALEKQYDDELRRANGEEGEAQTTVQVLPTLNAQGQLYDVGLGKDDGQVLPGNRKKKEKVCVCLRVVVACMSKQYLQVETRDPKTGELIRINADDDDLTLGEMLRQERFGGGMADQKNLDAQFAKQIMSDGKFQVRERISVLRLSIHTLLHSSRMTLTTSTTTRRS